MGKYQITGWRPGDEAAIAELFRLAYGRELSPEAWRWQFLDNPYQPLRMINLWDGGRLAAHTAVTIFQGYLDGRERRMAYSGHTMAHRDYPGISKLLLSRMRETFSDLDILYAFPNQNSFRIFRDVLGFFYLGDVRFWLAEPLPGGALPEGIREIPRFQPEHGELFRPLIPEHRLITKRDLTRLRWRIEEKPRSGYRLFEYRDGGGLRGYMALNLFSGEGALQGQVIDLAAPRREDADRLLAYARAYFGRLGCGQVKLWLTSGRYREVLEGQGFRPDSRAFPMISGSPCCAVDEMYLTMIDSDVF